ncbi:PD-(D/E)XK nuclease family protein [uncultured Croceitalea sp.]|uniref:PD-(D/E)XK nuclease family protein n=1 Tax=uncultured Croceitalea sp. TaxID=1798908 RepID=UPI00330685B2
MKKYIAEEISTPIFLPKILSIEEFILVISELRKIDTTELVFRLFDVYNQTGIKDKDDFLTFNRWATTLLADFDELDRYLVDADAIFDYLTAIKRIQAWDNQDHKSDLVTGYINFTKSFKELYSNLRRNLLEDKLSYQGLRYEIATKRLPLYIEKSKDNPHIFIGFNGLNMAENQIIQKLLESTNSEVYWDLDTYFLHDTLHDAGYFIRQHLKNWAYFSTNTLHGLSSDYLDTKYIEITGIPKNISQAKYVGNLLSQLAKTAFNQPVALVLADETLLPAIINSLPINIGPVNITMGFPLEKTSTANFFEILLDFYDARTNSGWYFEDVLRLFSHPITKTLFNNPTTAHKVAHTIHKNNYVFLSPSHLKKLFEEYNDDLERFLILEPNSKSFVETSLNILTILKNHFAKHPNLIEQESLFLFSKIFNQISDYIQKRAYLDNFKTLKGLMVELVSIEKLNFKGNPTSGLQIMGMLESRTLDFETVIMTSVNEGILPAGKSNNSFIPYDVKKEFSMPTFKDKDAVYAYHFYRLIQRAKTVYLTYNTESDVLEGGERSRFITQLLTDENIKHNVRHQIASPSIPIRAPKDISIVKSQRLVEDLKSIALSGFSPTSLSNYIRNPYTFYQKNVLKIKETENVEETMAYNTFGTIIHDVLEVLLKPFVGQIMTEENLLATKKSIPQVTKQNFVKTFSDQNLDSGQNLIAFNVIKTYISNVIDFEIAQSKTKQIKLIALEHNLKIELNISELPFPIFLKGKLDRIDEVDGQVRIIDYKTGNVTSSELELTAIEQVIVSKNKSKAFQLLCYGLMCQKFDGLTNIQAGIFPIKKMKSGMLNFAIKPSPRAAVKNRLIDMDVIHRFEEALKGLILELFDTTIPFTDTGD